MLAAGRQGFREPGGDQRFLRSRIDHVLLLFLLLLSAWLHWTLFRYPDPESIHKQGTIRTSRRPLGDTSAFSTSSKTPARGSSWPSASG